MGRFLIGILVWTIVLPSICLAGEPLYVLSFKAPLFQRPAMGSKKVGELDRGTKINVVETRPGWVKIQFSSKNAWVFSLMTGEKPPIMIDKTEKNKIQELGKSARRRPSAYVTTAAARGLRDSRKRFAKIYKLDFSELKKMESIEITNQEAMRFLREGMSNENK